MTSLPSIDFIGIPILNLIIKQSILPDSGAGAGAEGEGEGWYKALTAVDRSLGIVGVLR